MEERSRIKEKWIKAVSDCKDEEFNADKYIIEFSKEWWPDGNYDATLILIAGMNHRTKDKVKEWISRFR